MALAGGTQVVVAAVAGQIWVTTGFDVVKLDASTGRVERRNKTRYVAPIDIGVSDGNVWVSSVADGFTSGAVTRIPYEAGRVTQPRRSVPPGTVTRGWERDDVGARRSVGFAPACGD